MMKRRRGAVLRRAARFGGRLGLLVGALLAVTGPRGRAEAPPPAAGAVSVGEQIFFQRLGDLVEAGKWPEAVRHIQQVQALRPEPAWLAPRDGDLRLAQIRIARGQDDLAGLLHAARLYLNGDDARSQRLLALAREMHAAGEKTAAIALVKEVVSRTPEFAAAQRVLAEWEPPAAKKPAAPKSKAGSGVDDAAAQLALLRSQREQNDTPAMLASARLFLTGDRSRAQKLLEVAREFHGRGDKAAAIMLVKEVLRRTPGFPPAQRLLAEFEAAPASPP